MTIKNLLLIITLSVIPNVAFAETNIDFFFKTDSQYQDVVVQKVINTHLIQLQGKTNVTVEGLEERIRLIGLRSPEIIREPVEKTQHPEIIKRNDLGMTTEREDTVNPVTPLNEKALEYTKELLEGKRVRLEFDSTKKDEKFQTLAYVFLLEDNTFVNAEIIRQGYANLQISPPNTKYAKELRAAYKEARQEKRGLQGQ